MTKREALRQTEQARALLSLGFTQDEAEALRRISMTLRRWYERECGDGTGCIERDETTDKPVWRHAYSGHATPIPDREAGARRRLEAIVKVRNRRVRVERSTGDVLGPATSNLSTYLQTDPRGAALYILRPGDVPDGYDVASYYTRGICVY